MTNGPADVLVIDHSCLCFNRNITETVVTLLGTLFNHTLSHTVKVRLCGRMQDPNAGLKHGKLPENGSHDTHLINRSYRSNSVH